MRIRSAAILTSFALIAAACGARGATSASSGSAQGSSATSGASGGSGTSGLQSSDVGISPTSIQISTIEDVGGPDPGLFESSKDAMQAFVAYQNSIGGVEGRKLVLTTYDSAIDPTKFQAFTQTSCSSDFAVVGSYSIGDNGGVSVGQQCGIPEVPAATTAPQVLAAHNVVAPLPLQPNQISTGYFHWLAQTYPNAVTKAGTLFPDNQVTRVASQRVVSVAQTQGFHYLENQVVNLIQLDFTSFVLDMKNKGVQLFQWGADYQAMGRILQSMQQQSWHPQVFDGTAAGYTQGFIRQSGPSAQGMLMSLPISPLEEQSQIPMLHTYLTWLDKAAPGHVPPDIFGVSSWSAGLLFVKAVEQAGKNPTRAKVLDALHAIHDWNGDGIQAPTNPGSGIGTNCFVVVKVQGKGFVRVHPTQPTTFDCTGHLYTVPGIPPASAQ